MNHLLLFISLLTVSPDSDKIIGEWIICEKSKSAVVSIEKNNNLYNGVIVWLPDMKQNDINNPDVELKSTPLLNKKIITGLEYVGNGNYENGILYDPKSGKTYGIDISHSDDQLKVWIHLQSFSWLGQTNIWPLNKKK